MSKFKDLTGKKIGRLEVLCCAKKDKHGNYRWLCKCDCGSEKIIYSSSLHSGNTKSCGCLHREIVKKINHESNMYHIIIKKKKRSSCFDSLYYKVT